MDVYDTGESREEYIQTQIDRSKAKYDYCKVSYQHVAIWKNILKKNKCPDGPKLCLGTRNGREIDLFRVNFNSGIILNKIVSFFERRRNGWHSMLPLVESFYRGSIESLNAKSVVGVELNPDAKRKDVFIGSFDDMPNNWADTFSVIYSNSFDQSQDPDKSAKEWLRVIKNGGFLILGFTETESTPTDPVGSIKHDDLLKIFPGELIYYNKSGSNYNDLIIKIIK